MAVAAVLGMSIEFLAYRPVRSAPRLTPLITAIGVSLFLQNAGMLLFSPNPQRYPAILREVRFEVLGVIVTNIKLTIFGVALALMLGLHLFVQKTWTGRAMRALSFNIDAAKLMGIDTNRVIRSTFAIGSALAAAGGILFGLDQITINPLMGVLTGLKAFVAAVLGGIGSIPGAVVGGLLIGLAEQLTAGYLSPAYRDANHLSDPDRDLATQARRLARRGPRGESLSATGAPPGCGHRRAPCYLWVAVRLRRWAERLRPAHCSARRHQHHPCGRAQSHQRYHRPILDRPRRFMAVGAYGAAYVGVKIAGPMHSAIAQPALANAAIFNLALVAGALFAGISGLIVGMPSLRLRGDYWRWSRLALVKSFAFYSTMRPSSVRQPATSVTTRRAYPSIRTFFGSTAGSS